MSLDKRVEGGREKVAGRNLVFYVNNQNMYMYYQSGGV